MKKYVLMTAAVMALSVPGPAWSQTAPGGGPGAPPQGGASPGGGGQWQQDDKQKFAEHKNEVLMRMNQHLAEVQKRIGCVQAATNHEQLHACLPEMGRGGGGGGQNHAFGGNQGNGGPPPQEGGNGGPPPQ